MDPRATVVRASDGTERVVLDLADFQALLDAADAATHGLPEIEPLVRRLRVILDQAPDSVDLEDFLAEYDALHGKG
jgi:hypothetical protein